MLVYDQGRYLARRWEEEDGVNLYLLPGGVFVELYYDTHRNEIARLRAFTSSDELLDFVGGVRLPGLD
ncbi:hypothetical protein [Hymenobacter perfusus]|uniref:Uncharacterized protein n=1 Tax=Hymenobacter perfusus TaxID=1236770 RepID=A0A3R9MRG0_9BACT|nr:hypothetical protein [Hymenobacter perfusus]RSK38903.1 hypothetical protein EI293_20490 [Hymenobacter perfusus]